MSYICQYKDPESGSWQEKEFEFEEQAYIFGRQFRWNEYFVYHS